MSLTQSSSWGDSFLFVAGLLRFRSVRGRIRILDSRGSNSLGTSSSRMLLDLSVDLAWI